MRKGGRSSFLSEKGREKSDEGWRNLLGKKRKQQTIDLGIEADIFQPAIKKYGVWPTTVWDCNFTDRYMKELKAAVGDGCNARPGSGTLGYQSFARTGSATHSYKTAMSGSSAHKVTESIFNPILAIWIMNLYAPQKGVVYDPFCGGGTRAIVSYKKGLDYTGIELRQEEIEAVEQRLLNNNAKAKIVLGDSKNPNGIPPNYADFLITCPPYFNLEMYEGGTNDLSMAKSYDDFLSMIEPVVVQSCRILKPGALSCWVVGLHRDSKGGLLSIPQDIARIHKANGFKHKEEVIINWTNTGAISRVGNFEKGQKLLIRSHEYLEVFEKQNKTERKQNDKTNTGESRFKRGN